MRKKLKLTKPKCKHCNVMLIDDNEMDNFINQKIIEANFFADSVYTNINGLSAIEFLNNLVVKKGTLDEMLPEVIFIDLNMPIMNGFQFIEKFYELPKEIHSRIKPVILTSSLDEGDRQTAAKINKNILFLNKPLTKESLDLIV